MTRPIALKLLTLSIMGTFAGSLYAGTSETGTAPTTVTTSGASTTAVAQPVAESAIATKYAAVFSQWAGSTDNALALLDGLHNGTAITLSEPAPIVPIAPIAPTGSATGSTAGSVSGSTTGSGAAATATLTTFTAPTKAMSYRQGYIAFALAQKELAGQGISNPTPAQIRTVLDGGSLTTANGTTSKTVQLPGILTLRASGMGWGKIAQQVGLKLGPVMASLNRNSASLKAAAAGAASGFHNSGNELSKTQAPSHRSYGQGIVSATGASLSPIGSDAATRGAHHTNPSSGSAPGNSSNAASAANSGIVTAMGASGQSALASNNGHGHGGPH